MMITHLSDINVEGLLKENLVSLIFAPLSNILISSLT